MNMLFRWFYAILFRKARMLTSDGLSTNLPNNHNSWRFVHISSIAANQFMKLFANITDPKEYESRFFEVGVLKPFEFNENGSNNLSFII